MTLGARCTSQVATRFTLGPPLTYEGFLPLPHACIILGMMAAVAGLERQQGSARRADQPLDQLDVGRSQIFAVGPDCKSQMCNMPGTAERVASGSLLLGASMFPDAPLLLPEARPPPLPPPLPLPSPPPSSPSLRSS